MLKPGELADLRKEGAKDDDILNRYREFAPEHRDDIDKLRKEGESPKKILDGLANYYGGPEAPKEAPKADPGKADPMESAGILDKTRGALQYGASNALSGLGSTAEMIGMNNVSRGLKGAATSIAPAGYDAAGPRFDVMKPSSYGYAPRALLEGAPGLASDVAAGTVGTAMAGPVGSVAGFMASNAARNAGPNLDARMANQGPGAKPSNQDYAAVAGSTALEAGLSRLGIAPGLSSAAKGAGMGALAQVPGQIAKAGLADAAAGAAGDVVNQVGRSAGTDKGLSVDLHDAANAAGLSGLTGAAVRTARGTSDVLNAKRFSGIDEAAGGRLVDRLDSIGIAPKNAESSYKAVDTAKSSLNAELNEASRILKPSLKGLGDDTSGDASRVLLNESRAILNKGVELPEGRIEQLKSTFGETAEGQRVVSLMEEHHALNQLTKTGRYEKNGENPNGYFAGGLASNPLVNTLLNPVDSLKSKLSIGSVGAGVAGLSGTSAIAAMAPLIAKGLAAQGAVYAGVRGMDRLTGMRNPAKEFTDRFRQEGGPAAPSAEAPSFRQDALEAQQLQRDTYQASRDQRRQDALVEAKQKTDDRQAKQETKDQEKADKAKTLEEETRKANENKAWKAKQAEDARKALEDSRKAKEVDAAYEAVKPATETSKARQEAELWARKQANDRLPPAERWNDAEALAATQGKNAVPGDTLRDALAKLKATQGPGKAKEAPGAPEATRAPPKAPKSASEAPRATERPSAAETPSVNTIRVTHEGQVIERPKEGVRNVPRYVAATKLAMEARHDFVEDLRANVPGRSKRVLNELLTDLNGNAKHWKGAELVIADKLNQLPESHWNQAWDIYNKHEAAIQGTYKVAAPD